MLNKRFLGVRFSIVLVFACAQPCFGMDKEHEGEKYSSLVETAPQAASPQAEVIEANNHAKAQRCFQLINQSPPDIQPILVLVEEMSDVNVLVGQGITLRGTTLLAVAANKILRDCMNAIYCEGDEPKDKKKRDVWYTTCCEKIRSMLKANDGLMALIKRLIQKGADSNTMLTYGDQCWPLLCSIVALGVYGASEVARDYIALLAQHNVNWHCCVTHKTAPEKVNVFDILKFESSTTTVKAKKKACKEIKEILESHGIKKSSCVLM